VLVAGVGIAAGVRTWVGQRDRAMIADSVNGLVDELFAEPLLANAGPPIEDQVPGFRDWLEDRDPSFLP
jgi:hypothetical protein